VNRTAPSASAPIGAHKTIVQQFTTEVNRQFRMSEVRPRVQHLRKGDLCGKSDTPGESGGLMSVTASKAVVLITGCHGNVETESPADSLQD
jgi:hypothetical protein